MNQVGSPVMADPGAYPIPPLRFVAADDAPAKALVIQLLDSIGFDARDAGDRGDIAGADHALKAMDNAAIADARKDLGSAIEWLEDRLTSIDAAKTRVYKR